MYDFLNMRQICFVEFKTEPSEELAIVSDPMKEFILIKRFVRVKDKYGNEIIEKVRHYLFVINKEEYYQKERCEDRRSEEKGSPIKGSRGKDEWKGCKKFFRYCIELPFDQFNLFLISSHK